jgi:hypothetical protein
MRIYPKLEKSNNKKAPKKEPFYRKNIIGINPIFGQDYPGITPWPKMAKILI